MKSKIILVLLVASLLFSCSHALKFNRERALEIRENTVLIMDTVQELLIAWPMYSGWIHEALDPYRDQLPIPPEFWEAMDSLDELAKYCPPVTEPDAPPGEKCDFSEWQPEILLGNVQPKVKVKIFHWAYDTYNGALYTELGPRIVYEGKKRTEYATGYAAGDMTIMGMSLVIEVLKKFKDYVPEVGKILKYISIFAL